MPEGLASGSVEYRYMAKRLADAVAAPELRAAFCISRKSVRRAAGRLMQFLAAHPSGEILYKLDSHPGNGVHNLLF